MKKALSIFLALVLLVTPLLGLSFSANAETYIPSRTINLVYDDSGSMIKTGGQYVDTWCQAKYAMEVFAAMLGERDTLNIYYMSDYVFSTEAPPKLTLTGSRNASVTEANVQKIHDLVTDSSETPFNSVKKAYSDLAGITTDEQWLVVLTDGEFNQTSNAYVENYFHKCVSDGKTKVMMLAMGPNAAAINPDPGKGIYFEKAENTTDILAKLTKICNHIFQNNTLPMDGLSSSFNVPMSELIVFAQGKDVKIQNITDAEGNVYKPSSNVKVQYCEEATTDTQYSKSQIKVADDLMGYVATFDSDFNPGSYTFNVTGADNVQVYYKPNVTIAAYLYDDDGEEVTAQERLISGTYRVEYGFLNATNGEKVTDTSLLGKIEYASSMVNTAPDGTANTLSVKNGDTITITEGTLEIDVSARFLEYNTVHAQLKYDVFCQSQLIFKFEDMPEYMLRTDGLEGADVPMVLTVVNSDNGQVTPLSAEQWELLGIPQITTKAALDPFRVERTDEIGKYLVYPVMKNNDPMQTATGTIDVHVEGSFVHGLSSAEGSVDDSFRINTDITDWARFLSWLSRNWLWLSIVLFVVIWLFGYIPGVKKYLPRQLKKSPEIRCKSLKPGIKSKNAKGKLRRNFLSTILPYKSQTGKITFAPSPNKKSIEVRAAGGSRMLITNVKSFAGKNQFTFDGSSIDKEQSKPYPISGSSNITYKTEGFEYSCYLSN